MACCLSTFSTYCCKSLMPSFSIYCFEGRELRENGEITPDAADDLKRTEEEEEEEGLGCCDDIIEEDDAMGTKEEDDSRGPEDGGEENRVVRNAEAPPDDDGLEMLPLAAFEGDEANENELYEGL